MNKKLAKQSMIIGMALVVAMFHIVGIAQYTSGMVSVLYSSYFSDIVIPFMVYFLLCNIDFLPKWWQKAALTFGIAATAEFLQYFGIDALGSTFDPIDIVAYAAGVLLAALVERQVFARYFKFWD